jgi:pyruvate dehydrogenase E2 component (dihydrolipoamide acetyltransferase)
VPELLRMPEVAAGTGSARLAQWLVEEGGQVPAGQPLALVETDKASVDLDAPGPVRVVRRLAEAGQDLEVGTPLALLAAWDEPLQDPEAALAALGLPAAEPVGTKPGGTEPGGTKPVDALTPPDPRAGGPLAGTTPGPDTPGTGGPGTDGHGRRFASPLARRLAARAGIPLDAIEGTGPGGRVVRADVERAIATRTVPAAAIPAAGAAAPAVPTPAVPTPAVPTSGPTTPSPPDEAVRRIPHSRLRLAIANRLSAAKAEVPHFYLRRTLRAEALEAFRADLRAAGVEVSLTALLVKAVAVAHRRVPALHVRWTPDALEVPDRVDVGVAVAVEGGLVAPVLRDVDRRSLGQLGRELSDLAERARGGQLRQAELEGGTITVSNLGMFGTEEFAAVLNPPQAAILAVGAVFDAPVVDPAGALRAGRVLHCTLSVDHRAVDGADAARWMAALGEVLERPLALAG